MKNGQIISPLKKTLVSLIAKMGEKITIGKAKTFNEPGTKNFSYLHTVVKDNLSKLSVIVSIRNDQIIVIMVRIISENNFQCILLHPILLAFELQTLIEQRYSSKRNKILSQEELKNSGKTDDIAKKISLGKMNKFKEDNAHY